MKLKTIHVLLAAVTIFFCEFLGDYVKLSRCSWPKLASNIKGQDEELQAMILADTHLLGPINGHWLDKFYREWHMRSAFRAAIQLLKPDVVFVLGDLFDEGDMVNHDQFKNYVERFHWLFPTPSGVPIISAVGNHDVGFHYKMHPFFTERFKRDFNNTGVDLYSINNIHFVFINSMAMENDRCYFCERAKNELQKVADRLECLKRIGKCKDPLFKPDESLNYSRPIIMQHFPTYRVSDKVCYETDTEKFEQFRENWEVLSKEATKNLGNLLKPRLAFAGHSHNYCYYKNRWNVDEYTVASFNWRNKVNPSFLLATFTAKDYKIGKCNMLQQHEVYRSYYIAVLSGLFATMCKLVSIIRKNRANKRAMQTKDK